MTRPTFHAAVTADPDGGWLIELLDPPEDALIFTHAETLDTIEAAIRAAIIAGLAEPTSFDVVYDIPEPAGDSDSHTDWRTLLILAVLAAVSITLLTTGTAPQLG